MKISNHQIADLQSLLAQCVNIPFEDTQSFVNFLDLREKLDKGYKEYNATKVKLLTSFNVESKNNMFVYTEHPDKSKIDEALVLLADKKQDIEELQSLNITNIELAKICVGLKNFQMDFLKYWLIG